MIVHSFLIGDSPKYGKNQVLSETLKYNEISKHASAEDIDAANGYNDMHEARNARILRTAKDYIEANGFTNIREEKHYMKPVYRHKWSMVDYKCVRISVVPFKR